MPLLLIRWAIVAAVVVALVSRIIEYRRSDSSRPGASIDLAIPMLGLALLLAGAGLFAARHASELSACLDGSCGRIWTSRAWGARIAAYLGPGVAALLLALDQILRREERRSRSG